MAAIFITGTDTGVGKTALTGAIARVLREDGIDVGVSKPIATGCRPEGEGWISCDVEFLCQAASCCDPLEIVCTYAFEDPVAPRVAAERAGREIFLPDIISNYFVLLGAHDLVLMEGIGGLLVPLNRSQTLVDLIRLIHTPVLIVSRNQLGTLNHTLLTIDCLKRKKIPIIGVILNHANTDEDASQTTNAESITESTGVPVLGILPYSPDVDVEKGQMGGLPGLIREHVDLSGITKLARVLR